MLVGNSTDLFRIISTFFKNFVIYHKQQVFPLSKHISSFKEISESAFQINQAEVASCFGRDGWPL